MPVILEEPGIKMPVALPRVTPKQFEEFCRRNPDLRAERTATGELIVMAPTYSKTGIYNARLTRQFDEYAERTGSGYAFDSSAGFALPKGGEKSPDASWVTKERWDALTDKEQEGYVPLCPDVVVELMSTSDSLTEARDKMLEYQANGARLGLLIDRKRRRVYIYRRNQLTQTLNDPTEVSCDPEMPGFSLKMKRLFDL